MDTAKLLGTGTVLGIQTAEQQGTPMQDQRQIEAIAGLGLAGDRYAKQIGFWQSLGKPARKNAPRDLTFIFEASLRAVLQELPADHGLTVAELFKFTRRNILIAVGDSNESHFLADDQNLHVQINDVVAQVTEPCTPCKRPGQLSERADLQSFARLFRNRGGLRCRITQSGWISLGDPVQIYTSS